jgi:hypothetical protein
LLTWFGTRRSMVQIHSPDHFTSPQIQQLHAAFLETTALRFGCESSE